MADLVGEAAVSDDRDGSKMRLLKDENERNEFRAEMRLEDAHERITPATDLSTVQAVDPFNEVDTRAIIRQVEYYFSDQNLPTDAHLLGLTGGDGNGPVSLNRIMGFKKMRQYRPPAAAKNVIELSTVLELVDNRKKIKRRIPLVIQPQVMPRYDTTIQHVQETLAANPHLTKGMIKPTGFEEYYADAPLTPEQYARERELYHDDASFETRIESAIRMFKTKRKMHQMYERPFQLWMNFGGIDVSETQFTGGTSTEEMEAMDKEELAYLRCPYGVGEHVIVHDEMFEVDFENVALAFLSTEFPTYFRPESSTDIVNVCNIMINFFNYILHHDVCREYTQQIVCARKAVEAAELELHQLVLADKAMQSVYGFQTACTVLHELPKADDDPWEVSREIGYSIPEAGAVFLAGLAQMGTAEQHQEAEQRWSNFSSTLTEQQQVKPSNPEQGKVCGVEGEDEPALDAPTSAHSRLISAGWTQDGDNFLPPKPLHSPLRVVAGEELGLEIVALTASEHVGAATTAPRLGRMKCRRCEIPGRELELDILDKFGQPMPDELDFIVDEGVLEACEVGMKLQCEVRKLDIGIYYFERVERTLPSFYTYMPDYKQVKAYFQHVDGRNAVGMPGSTENAEHTSTIIQQLDDTLLVDPAH